MTAAVTAATATAIGPNAPTDMASTVFNPVSVPPSVTIWVANVTVAARAAANPPLRSVRPNPVSYAATSARPNQGNKPDDPSATAAAWIAQIPPAASTVFEVMLLNSSGAPCHARTSVAPALATPIPISTSRAKAFVRVWDWDVVATN